MNITGGIHKGRKIKTVKSRERSGQLPQKLEKVYLILFNFILLELKCLIYLQEAALWG